MWSPKDYIDAAFIAEEAQIEMLNRLELMTIQPKVIVDMGCGTGEASRALKKRYPNAQVIALDLSCDMLNYTQQEQGVANNHLICADTGHLPFADQSVDLIFANFLLPWYQDDMQCLFQEWRRILCAEGLLMFTALGVNTVKEIHHLIDFKDLVKLFDMHDIGDALLAEKFLDPVLDTTSLASVYKNNDRLITDLSASGVYSGNTSNLSKAIEQMTEIELTFEIIYAHTFAPEPDLVSVNKQGEAHLPLRQLRKMLKKQK